MPDSNSLRKISAGAKPRQLRTRQIRPLRLLPTAPLRRRPRGSGHRRGARKRCPGDLQCGAARGAVSTAGSRPALATGGLARGLRFAKCRPSTAAKVTARGFPAAFTGPDIMRSTGRTFGAAVDAVTGEATGAEVSVCQWASLHSLPVAPMPPPTPPAQLWACSAPEKAINPAKQSTRSNFIRNSSQRPTLSTACPLRPARGKATPRRPWGDPSERDAWWYPRPDASVVKATRVCVTDSFPFRNLTPAPRMFVACLTRCSAKAVSSKRDRSQVPTRSRTHWRGAEPAGRPSEMLLRPGVQFAGRGWRSTAAGHTTSPGSAPR